MAIRYRRYRANNFRFTRQASIRELELTGTIVLVALLTYFSTHVSMATLWLIFIFIVILGLIAGVIAFTIFRRIWRRTARALQVLGVIDIDQMEVQQFESYIETLLRAQGYHVMQIVSDPEGTLFITKKGKKLVGIKLFRQTHAVNPALIRQALTAKNNFGLQAITIMTTDSFTPAARHLAFTHRASLIDRRQLAHWILDFHEDQI